MLFTVVSSRSIESLSRSEESAHTAHAQSDLSLQFLLILQCSLLYGVFRISLYINFMFILILLKKLMSRVMNKALGFFRDSTMLA